MQTIRQESDFGTEIYIFFSDEAFARRDVWNAYRVRCADFDHDAARAISVQPTARISLLCASMTDVATARRLATEYAQVADIAEALEAEKRTAYAKWLEEED